MVDATDFGTGAAVSEGGRAMSIHMIRVGDDLVQAEVTREGPRTCIRWTQLGGRRCVIVKGGAHEAVVEAQRMARLIGGV